MAEVEAEIVRCHKGALLLHMGAEDAAQGIVEKVGGGVVGHDPFPSCLIDMESECTCAVLRDALGKMDCEVVFLDRVDDGYLFARSGDHISGVPDLSAHFSIERGAVKHELVECLVFLLDGPVLEKDCILHIEGVVAEEYHFFAGLELGPVAELVGRGVACALLLLCHFRIEAGLVHGKSVLGGNQLGEVVREAVGVVELEGVPARDDLGVGISCHAVVHKPDAAVESLEEGFLFLTHHGGNQRLLRHKLRIGFAHVLAEPVHKTAEERLVEPEEGVAVAHCTAQDAADDIAGLDIGRKLAVGDGEGYGPDMVGNHAHCHLGLCRFVVAVAAELLDDADEAAEDVGIVVACLALKHHAKAFEAHSGVDVLVREHLQMAVGLAVVLHKDKVPDFDYLVIVGIDEAGSRDTGDFLVAAEVDVDLAGRSARACVSHFPEIVVLVAQKDMVLGHMLEPGAAGLFVKGCPVLGASLENGRIELAAVDSVHTRKELPCPVDGLGLEIVAEAPVAEHLEHCVVAPVVAHCLEVIVLSADPETLLAVCRTGEYRRRVAEEYVFELVHSGVGEHQRRVVLYYHRGGRDYGMALRFEKFQVLAPDFLGCHIFFHFVCLHLFRNFRTPVRAVPAI